ncbi:MAG: AsmA family protein, partial [Flavobacteriales bacterium]|nr:AsmA family protein [Flavobacteriales bacterium]
MKKVFKRISVLLLVLLLLAAVSLFLAVKTQWGNDLVTEKISDQLTRSLGVQVSIGSIDLNPFETLELLHVTILDHHADTMIQAERVYTDIGLFHLMDKKIHLEMLKLEHGQVNLKKHSGEDELNITRVIDDLKKDSAADNSWDFKLERVELLGMDVSHQDKNKAPQDSDRIDFADLHLKGVTGMLDQIDLIEKGISFQAIDVQLNELSGLQMKSLNARITVDDERLDVDSMDLMTGSSVLKGDLLIDYGRTGSDDLILDISLQESRLELAELGRFVKGYESMEGSVLVTTELKGGLSDLHLSHTDLQFGRTSRLGIDGVIKGLPELDSLWMDVEIDPLRSTVSDLRYLPVPGMEERVEKLPEEAFRLGQIDFKGNFRGSLQDFLADGILITELGRAEADMNVFLAENAQYNTYTGRLRLKDMDLGRLLENDQLGKMTSDLEVDLSGHGESVSAVLQGEVESLTYRGYAYRNLEVDGTLEERLFNGFLSISQPEIDMDFKGLVDLRSSEPHLRFTAQIFQADMQSLGFFSQLDSTSMTTWLEADFLGDDIDEFQGSVVAKSLSFCKGEQEYFLDDLKITASNEDSLRLLTLQSDMMDAQVRGQFAFKDLKNDFLAMFDEVIPSIYGPDNEYEAGQSRLTFQVDLKNTQDLTGLFIPDARIGNGTTLRGGLNAPEGDFSLRLLMDSLRYRFVGIQGIDLEMIKQDEVAYTALETRDMQWGDSLLFTDNFYTFIAYEDSIETDLTWTLVNKDASGSVSALSIIHSPDSIVNIIYPSQMIMSGDYWLTDGYSVLTYDEGELEIDTARVSNGTESIDLSGRIGKDQEDVVYFDVQDFQLEHLNKFLPPDMVDLDGRTELKGQAAGILG